MLNRKMKPIAAAVGAAFAVSLAAGVAVADEANPFEAEVLAEGTLFADAHKEGGCGEDAEGEAKEAEGEGQCGEGKCGESEGGDGDGASEEESADAES